MERKWSSPIVGVFAILYTLTTIGLCGLSMSSLPSGEACVGPEVWATSKNEVLKQLVSFFTGGSSALAEIISDNPLALAGAVGMMCGAVIFLMVGFRFCPKIMTWSLSFLTIFIWTALGVYMKIEFQADFAYVLFVMAVFGSIVLYCKRTAVNEAAMLFKAATYVITANPGMVLMTLLIQGVILAYGALLIGGIFSSVVAGTLSPVSTISASDLTITIDGKSIYCLYEKTSWGSNVYTFLSLSFTYQLLNFKMIRLYMVSVTTALWYWETDNTRVSWKACTGMKWAMSYGWGVVATAAIIVSLVDQITRIVMSKVQMCMNACNPFFWICYVVVAIFKEAVYALATFSMIMGAITGESFCLSASRAHFTLKGRFSTLFVVSGVSRTVVFSFATIVSFGSFLFVLKTVDTENIIEWSSLIWQVVITVLGLFSCSYSILTVFLVTIVSGILPSHVVSTTAPFLAALFAGALVNYLMVYFSEILLDVVNALFALAEIDRKNGIVPAENAPEGSPAAFTNYYYTEMSNKEVQVTQGGQVQGYQQHVQVPMQGTVVQGQPVQGQLVQGQVLQGTPQPGY